MFATLMTAFLNQLTSSCPTNHRKRRNRERKSRVRLRLEYLEDRCVPADIAWVGLPGEAWEDGDNWAGGQVPGANDTALFTALSFGCSINANHTVAGVTLAEGFIGELNFQGGNVLTVGAFIMRGGAIIGGGGKGNLDVGSGGNSASFEWTAGVINNVTVNVSAFVQAGDSVWGGGTLIASNLFVAGHLSINPTGMGGKVTIGEQSYLHNTGTLHWINGTIEMDSPAIVDNNGDFYISGNNTVTRVVGGPVAPVIRNWGTIAKSGGTGETKILSHFVNHSQVNVLVGRLAFGSTSTHNGPYVAAAFTEVAMYAATHTLQSGFSFSGSGMLSIEQSGANGSVFVPNGVSVRASNAQIVLAGILKGDGTFSAK